MLHDPFLPPELIAWTSVILMSLLAACLGTIAGIGAYVWWTE